jgi:hypothetical protein
MTKTELQKDLKKPKQPQDRVLELINWIQDNESKIFKPLDGFRSTSVLVIGFFVAVVVIAGYKISDFTISITITLASIGALIAFFSFMNQEFDVHRANKRFINALQIRTFDDREKPLLKVLIKIKNDNEEINLKTLYMMDKEVNGETFSEKNLISVLCK